jgi:hypothetical protein
MDVNMHIQCGNAIEIKGDMIHAMMDNATSYQVATAHVIIQQKGMTQGTYPLFKKVTRPHVLLLATYIPNSSTCGKAHKQGDMTVKIQVEKSHIKYK